MAHRARDARHAAADARALERGARGDRAAERATLISQRHFAVRADIEKQPQFRLREKPVRHQSRRDVAADIARDARGKSHRDPRKRLARAVFKQRFRLKRRAGNGRDLAPVENVLHHGIACNDELLDFIRLPSGGGKCPLQKRPDLRADTARQLAQPVGRFHRVLDAADNVRAVGRLRVPVLSLREQLSVCAVEEPQRHRRRTEVDCRAKARAARLRLWQCERVRQDDAAHRLGQVDPIAVLRFRLAGKARHTVHLHAAFAAAALAAAGCGDVISRPPQRGEQRLPCFERGRRDFRPLLNLNA